MRMISKNLLFWFGVFAMALLVMVRPAYAVVESVAPTSGGKMWCARSSGCSWSPQIKFSTVAGACNRYMDAAYRDMFYTLVSGDTYMCKAYRVSDSVQVNLDYADLASNTAATCPTATPPYTYNPASNMCERTIADCPASGTAAGAYWINTGTVPSSIYSAGLGQFCSNGCQTSSFTTIPRPADYPVEDGATKIVNGVRQYYSFREYQYTGATCTGNTQLASITVPAQDTCAAGQSVIQMGSKFRCLNSATGQIVDTNSASAVAAAQTLKDAAAASAVAAAQAAAQAAGLSASGVESARSVAAGVAAAGGASGGSSSSDPVQSAFCSENPDASICKAQTEGARTVGTAALSGLYTNGDLISGKTVASVVGGFKNRVLASGIGGASSGFFNVNVAGGACPVWSASIPTMGTLTFDFYCGSTFQNLLPWIKSVLLIIFSVIAFRIAIL